MKTYIKEAILSAEANALQKAVEIIKREDKWDAVEVISDIMWNKLDELEELRNE